MLQHIDPDDDIEQIVPEGQVDSITSAYLVDATLTAIGEREERYIYAVDRPVVLKCLEIGPGAATDV